MRFGLPHWIGAGPPEKAVAAAPENGFDFVEVSLDEPWPAGLDAGVLADACRDHGVGLGLHAPWRAQTIAHPRRPLARAAELVLKSCVDFARAAGAEYVVVHVAAGAFAPYPDTAAVDEGMGHARAGLKRLVRRAGAKLAVLVENTEPPVGTPAEMAALLDDVPGLDGCLDVGHAAKVAHDGIADASEDAAVWLDRMRRRVGLVHFMDWTLRQGRVRDHLLPGAGDANLGAVLAAVGKSACDRVLIEAFYTDAAGNPATPKDLARARDALVAPASGR